MKKSNEKKKATVANQFYEEWMDYKDRERRASSVTTETIQSVKNGKYQLYDEYKARLSQTPTISSSIPPQPVVSSPVKTTREAVAIIQPVRQREEKSRKSKKMTAKTIDWNNLDDNIKDAINREFGPFYNWVRNGRTDDLKREIIEKLLFRENKK